MDLRIQHRIENENGAGAHRMDSQCAAAHPEFVTQNERHTQSRPYSHDDASQTDGEAALVHLARSGDRDAFSDLISGHCKTLFRLALRITKNREDAEDVVQDSILKAHANLSRFQGRARFSTWISRIAINEALMKLRKNRRRRQVPLEVSVQTEKPDVSYWEVELRQEHPETVYARMEMRKRVLQAASSLLPIDQAVLLLTRVRGCTNQETADELGLSIASVKARLHRACKHLREKLNPMTEAPPC